MNLRHIFQLSALIAAAWLISAPTARATWAVADSADTAVETRYVQVESGNIAVDTHDYANLTITAPHGTVPGAGSYLANTTVNLTATPDPGYLFGGWTGDATGAANPLSFVMDTNKSIAATFVEDTRDPDGDGLTNYQELAVYHTDPNLWDTDGDGFSDGFEVASGFSPTDPNSRPDSQMEITTAVEVSFPSAPGQPYRIESSTDLQTWSAVTDGVGVDGGGNIVRGGHITGTGDTITLWYSIRNMPKRYFRAVRE